MIVKQTETVPSATVTMEGAHNVAVRVVFGPADAAPTVAMRIFDMGPGGHTPRHTHGFEHEVLVLAGRITLVTDAGDRPLQPGDAVLVPPEERHQFRNASDSDTASFLCLVPVAYQS